MRASWFTPSSDGLEVAEKYLKGKNFPKGAVGTLNPAWTPIEGSPISDLVPIWTFRG
jgi:hypothetical protein